MATCTCDVGQSPQRQAIHTEGICYREVYKPGRTQPREHQHSHIDILAATFSHRHSRINILTSTFSHQPSPQPQAPSPPKTASLRSIAVLLHSVRRIPSQHEDHQRHRDSGHLGPRRRSYHLPPMPGGLQGWHSRNAKILSRPPPPWPEGRLLGPDKWTQDAPWPGAMCELVPEFPLEAQARPHG